MHIHHTLSSTALTLLIHRMMPNDCQKEIDSRFRNHIYCNWQIHATFYFYPVIIQCPFHVVEFENNAQKH